MDVIGFLCVSLGSSTVQRNGNLGNRRACACSVAGFSSQNGDRVWGVYYRIAAFCCAFFLWAKGLEAKDIHKEMFPVYGGKCLSRKAVHNWVASFSLMTKRLKRRCESGWERLLFCGFRRIGIPMRQLYQCWWRICQEINIYFFFRFEYHMFYVLHPFVTYLLTLPRGYCYYTGFHCYYQNR
jgi:hypothetical protein